MSRVLMPRSLMGGQGADIALQTIVSKGTPAFYLPDPNPARGYVFQDAAGTVPATAASQTLGLWVDESPSGNDASQSTEADEPTLNLTNGLYGVLGDGASKHFRTGLVPAANTTAIAAVNFTASNDAVIGSRNVGNGRLHIVTDGSGIIGGGAGDQFWDTIVGSTDVRNTPGIAALRITPSLVTLWWGAIGGSFGKEYEDTFSGSMAGATEVYLLSRHNGTGTSESPMAGDVYRALAQQSAYTDAEIAAIANQWSRELAALA